MNHTGSSKSMEASNAISLVEKIWNRGNITIKQLVIDDNSSIKANLRWNIPTRIEKGVLQV